MPTSNPALNDKIFEREIQASRGSTYHEPGEVGWGAGPTYAPPGQVSGSPFTPAPPYAGQSLPPTTYGQQQGTMRLGGVLSASAVLLLILVVTGSFGWSAVKIVTGKDVTGQLVVLKTTIPPWLIGSWIAGFALAIVTIFKPKVARITAPLYAAAEGLLVGGISHLFNVQYKGIVLQAIGLTVGVFLIMLFLFATRIIKVTNKLRTCVIASTGAVCLVYLASMIMGAFGAHVPLINDAGPLGIGFSLVVVAIASFNLLLDFDFVERGVAAGAPRYMEWYAAFGLMVTLVWLYLELLRLLAKLRQR